MAGVLGRLNRSLQRARAQALQQENLAAMGRMTAGIAHEIRNPLGIIRGAGQHLQRRLQETGIEDEVAGFIPEEVDRLDRILAGYLALGSDRASAPEAVDLSQLVRRSVQLVRSELAAAGCTVHLNEPLPAVQLRGDPRRLQQVLLNLLLNARDAMPAGGEVAVELARTDRQARITVTDSGEGLQDRDSRRAFEPFWTSKEKGSGLGLAVARRIAGEHGGELELANRGDAPGAVATLQLPVDDA